MPSTDTLDRREVRITRLLDAAPSRVFELWTKPEYLVRWWGPKDEEGRDFTVPACEVDARPGGRWRITMRAPNGKEYRHQGVFRVVEPPRRLAFTHAWEEEDGLGEETLITVTFEPVGDRTRLEFYQGVFGSAETGASHDQGWNECLDKLEELARHA